MSCTVTRPWHPYAYHAATSGRILGEMGTGRAAPRGRWAMVAVRLAMAAGLALVAVVGSVGLTPGRARPQPPSTAASPAPVAFGASAAPPTGCGTTPSGSPTTGDRVVTFTVGGRSREARVHVPTGYRADRPVPLLLDLHGSGSTAAKQEAQSGLDATGDAHGFLVAYPEGVRVTGTGFAWNIPGTPTFLATGPDDVAYVTRLLSVLHHDFCVDAARVYASGFSGGARMVSQLGCTPGLRLAGIAVAGGLRAPSPCQLARPLPVLAFHGTADLSNPFNGHGQPYWTYSVPEAASRWARYDGCPSRPQTTHPYPQVTDTDDPGCPDGAEVALYALTGKGHRWPAAAGAFQPDEIAWRFLSSHALTGTPPAV
jgi:polyhydroxybutyrate depolymerase